MGHIMLDWRQDSFGIPLVIILASGLLEFSTRIRYEALVVVLAVGPCMVAVLISVYITYITHYSSFQFLFH